jgi:hypothetical protein
MDERMTWNYRVVKYSHDEGYGIHEVYYLGDKFLGMTEHPVGPTGDSVGEIKETLSHMLSALDKDVINYDLR